MARDGATVVITVKDLDDDVRRSVSSVVRQEPTDTEVIVLTPLEVSPTTVISWTFCNPRVSIKVGSLTEVLGHVEAPILIALAAGNELAEGALANIIDSFVDSRVVVAYGDSVTTHRPGLSPVRFGGEFPMGGAVAFRPTAPIWIADNDEVAALRVPLCLEDQPESPAIDLLKPALSRFVNKGKGQRSPRSVSLIIPTRGQEGPSGRALVLDLIDSLGLGHDPSVDVVVVADKVTPTNVLTELGRYPSINVEMYNRPFNFADKCNQGALRAEGDIIFFLNDDMVHVDGNWKEILCRWLSDADIGAVGGLLLSPDGSVQCAGHANSPVPHLFGVGRNPESDPAVMFPRECSGLSGACLAVRREDFLQVGGMCIDLPNSYNDVDFCFKLLATGKRLLYTPEFRFLHFESASRNPTVDHAATELIHRRWGRYLKADPYPPPGT